MGIVVTSFPSFDYFWGSVWEELGRSCLFFDTGSCIAQGGLKLTE